MIDAVVYTALLGPDAPDSLPDPPLSADVEYVCFTDRDRGYMGWKTVRLDTWTHPRLYARYLKVASHSLFPSVKATIWLDASFHLLCDPLAIINESASLGLVVGFVHPDRQRMRDEARAVIACGQAPAPDVNRQVASYQAEGFDTDAQPQTILTTTGLLVRWRHPQTETFNRLWQAQFKAFTIRDQLSIDYCAWKLGLTIGHLAGSYRQNAYARYDRRRRINARAS